MIDKHLKSYAYLHGGLCYVVFGKSRSEAAKTYKLKKSELSSTTPIPYGAPILPVNRTPLNIYVRFAGTEEDIPGLDTLLLTTSLQPTLSHLNDSNGHIRITINIGASLYSVGRMLATLYDPYGNPVDTKAAYTLAGIQQDTIPKLLDEYRTLIQSFMSLT